MKARCSVLSVCWFIVICVFGEDVTVKEGGSVVLETDDQKKTDDTLLWYHEDKRIALINEDQSKSCLYDGEDGRFRDRLEVDYETGFLTITDIRFEHAGDYEAEIIRSQSSGKSQSLNRNRKCDRTKIIQKTSNLGETIKKISVNVEAKTEEESYKTEKENRTKEESYSTGKILAGTCGVGVLLVVVAAVLGVIYYRRWRSRNAGMEKNKPDRLLEDQRKDDSDVSCENPSSV
uniref:Immunoglobulin subtype domain-containing protein n=1 Tax=Cyprinus carpio carpio TaxID=630221 RepID=A0A9J8BIN7_CYPCA